MASEAEQTDGEVTNLEPTEGEDELGTDVEAPDPAAEASPSAEVVVGEVPATPPLSTEVADEATGTADVGAAVEFVGLESDMAKLSVEDRRARIAQALTRGLVNDWLDVDDAPPDRRHVWVRERREDIAKRRLLGYEIETTYGKQFIDHHRGDGIRRFGDCVLMYTSMDHYKFLKEVEAALKEQKLNVGIEEFQKKDSSVQTFDRSEVIS